MVDPLDQQLVIVTKELAGNSKVYVTSLDHAGALSAVTTLSLGAGRFVTAGDISASGDMIVLRTYTQVYIWERPGGETLATTFARPRARRPPRPSPERGARAEPGRRRVRHRERGRGRPDLGGRRRGTARARTRAQALECRVCQRMRT